MSTKQITGNLNGVPVQKVMDTIRAIRQDPELARFEFRATNKWLTGGHNRSTISDFYGARQEDTSRAQPFVLDADEPDVLAGEDRGANPVEFALHALVACLTSSMVYHAASRGIEIESVESRIEGDIDLRGFLGLSDEVRNGYENIRVSFEVKSDASAEQLAELASFSPVLDTIRNPVNVSLNVRKA